MASYKLPASHVLRIAGMDYPKSEEDLLNDILKRLSRTIKEYRKEHKITNAQLAQRCGISPSIMSRVESGYQNISLKTICKIFDVIGYTVLFKKERGI